ncbi:hypothetical protein [Rodentibacter genomosp. 2]|nr:hypothetical protein [Rodentibacter genomosp. 2]
MLLAEGFVEVYGGTAKGVHSLEQQITTGSGFVEVALRYGWLYCEGNLN